MENAADALKMAGAVLLFVMALSICIFSFSKARETTDLILSYKDEYRESDYAYLENNVNSEGKPVTERIVGLETVIPTMYRAYKENYKIVFKFINDSNYYIFKDKNGNDIKTIDLETTTKVANDKDAKKFIEGVLYHKYKKNDGTLVDLTGDNLDDFQLEYNEIKLNTTSLYDKLKGRTITEYLGVYYQEETDTEVHNDKTQVYSGKAEVPDANKTEKRIITYKVN